MLCLKDIHFTHASEIIIISVSNLFTISHCRAVHSKIHYELKQKADPLLVITCDGFVSIIYFSSMLIKHHVLEHWNMQKISLALAKQRRYSLLKKPCSLSFETRFWNMDQNVTSSKLNGIPDIWLFVF